MSHTLTKRQAIATARAAADAIIEQQTRRANGWDKGAFRDDVRIVDRYFTIAETLELHSADAFEASKLVSEVV